MNLFRTIRPQRPPVLRRRAALLLLVWGVLARLVAAETAATAPEYQVKAVFLFNFTKFVEWPATAFAAADSPVVIGVMGANPFGPALQQALAGETLNGRRLEVRHYATLMQDFSAAHVLFIPASEKGRAKTILRELANRPVLTVGESDDFTAQGGIINFVLVEGSVRFEINPDPAKRSGLKISSKLLSLPKALRPRR